MDSALRSEEGGGKRRMRVRYTRIAVIVALTSIARVPNPHPPLRGTLSRRERGSLQLSLGINQEPRCLTVSRPRAVCAKHY
jgi:hypothetical protein